MHYMRSRGSSVSIEALDDQNVQTHHGDVANIISGDMQRFDMIYVGEHLIDVSNFVGGQTFFCGGCVAR